MDITKVVLQHLEMGVFFTGGFAVKGQNAGREQIENDEPAHDVTIELEKIAGITEKPEKPLSSSRQSGRMWQSTGCRQSSAMSVTGR